jgi:hypothetical protein
MDRAQQHLAGKSEQAVVQGQTVVQMQASQFVTAMQVQKPRDKQDVLRRVLEEAELLGDQFFYNWTVKGKGGNSIVEGMSIEGAMAIAREYGNAAAYAEVAAEGNSRRALPASGCSGRRRGKPRASTATHASKTWSTRSGSPRRSATRSTKVVQRG